MRGCKIKVPIFVFRNKHRSSTNTCDNIYVVDLCPMIFPGEYVASGSDDGRWFIWEKGTGRLIKILVGDGAGKYHCIILKMNCYHLGPVW